MSIFHSIIIIIIIKNEKIRVTLCESAAWALYIVNSRFYSHIYAALVSAQRKCSATF